MQDPDRMYRPLGVASTLSARGAAGVENDYRAANTAAPAVVRTGRIADPPALCEADGLIHRPRTIAAFHRPRRGECGCRFRRKAALDLALDRTSAQAQQGKSDSDHEDRADRRRPDMGLFDQVAAQIALVFCVGVVVLVGVSAV